ncbi:putative major facilitator superfamily transporter [Acidiphilium multivorum AIU301]|uniref:Putative major facilitator superfamily transporter n=1 Tax=Acidiphilium multivorum (strain DSM 11245 / JCM 8867 / NBRC 100883 / AIU 301) TaxID=926570 RepID=F0IYJ1_ACIMA|nr:MFS transporter [Acidiphilium multivorum]BAJ80851.1 putative major facilitator superfamily transporter [Acidiphilium multivorum AIU301]GAN73634.1 major facilitator superfamily transporter [Acidiphilium multivorum AIU301]
MNRPPAVETSIPARLDRLAWGRFHWLVVVALGVTWILDGLEVTLVGSLSGAIAKSPDMQLSSAAVGGLGSSYVSGAVLGALLFGWLTDRLGRKRLFTVTLIVYLAGTIASGLAWNYTALLAFRFVTGMGIGGEYAAINATIQELVPARFRGFTDLVINGSYWIGAALGAAGALAALDPQLVPPAYGWRLAFILGGFLAATALALRRHIPESPRWLMTHGRPSEAEQIVAGIEFRCGPVMPTESLPTIRLRTDVSSWFGIGLRALLGRYRRRAVLGVCLMTAQAFCYNAIFFTYAIVLTKFYGVPGDRVGMFILPFALGNFAGPMILGRLFDTVGRRTMITATYATAGLLMIATGLLFVGADLSATGQTAAWTTIFFFASAAASSAYLTVSECFPLEIRAVAIALFYAFGTALGGIAGPLLFGMLIGSGERIKLFYGDLLGGLLMLGAAAVEAAIGVEAARRPLESVARPLSEVD